MSDHELIRTMLGRPVAFHSVLARISGSATAGLMLSQAIYWSSRTEDADGWFFKTQADWWKEIFLSRHEQDTARKRLKERGFVSENLKGNPATMHFRVNFDAIGKAIECQANSQQIEPAGKRQSSLPESGKQVCNFPASKIAGKRQTSSTESGKPYKEAEITTETTSESLFGNSQSSSPAKPKKVDGRFQPVVDAIKRCWPDGVLFDMGAEDGAAINRMLLRRNRWTAEELAECVVFRFLSENINPGESIKAWIGAVCDYSTGPRDKYDTPKPDLPYWKKQARRMLYGETAEQLPIPAPKPNPFEAVKVRDHKPWMEVIARLETKVNKHSWETWLKPTRGIGFDANKSVYFVQIPSSEFGHVNDKYGDLILDAMQYAAPNVTEIQFLCGTSP